MLRTALINSDDTDKTAETGTEKDFDNTVAAYVKQIEALRGEGVKLIVIPEKLARTRPQWVPAAQAKLAAAAKDAGATLVVGMDMRDGAKAYNVSWAFMRRARTRPRSIASAISFRSSKTNTRKAPARWRLPTAPASKSAKTWTSKA